MVLHGVGGKTIAEAKENLSYVEYAAWVSYREKHGSLHIGARVTDRLEGGFALLAYLIATAERLKHHTGRPFKMEDFMPRAAEEKSNEPTIDNVLKALGGKRG